MCKDEFLRAPLPCPDLELVPSAPDNAIGATKGVPKVMDVPVPLPHLRVSKVL